MQSLDQLRIAASDRLWCVRADDLGERLRGDGADGHHEAPLTQNPFVVELRQRRAGDRDRRSSEPSEKAHHLSQRIEAASAMVHHRI